MLGALTFERAAPEDAPAVAAILAEAAAWLKDQGMELWGPEEIARSTIEPDVLAGAYWLARLEGKAAGTFRFTLEDSEFWPEAKPGEAGYVHRLAVLPEHRGTGLARVMLDQAARLSEPRKYLRLDCESHRPRLRAFYERYGFRWVDDRQVGPYHVSRFQLALPPTGAGRDTS